MKRWFLPLTAILLLVISSSPAGSQSSQTGAVKTIINRGFTGTVCDTLPKPSSKHWQVWVTSDHTPGAQPPNTALAQSENWISYDNRTGTPLKVGLTFGQPSPSVLDTVQICVANFRVTPDGTVTAKAKWTTLPATSGSLSYELSVQMKQNPDGSATLSNVLAFMAQGIGPPPTPSA